MPMDDDAPPADPVDAAACEVERRAWLRAIVPFLQLRSHDTDPSPRVQLAFDRVHVAACERAVRLLNSDLVEPGAPD